MKSSKWLIFLRKIGDIIKSKYSHALLCKLCFVFILPLIMTYLINHDKRITYEFEFKKSRKMTIPSAPHPYLSKLFEDMLLSLGLNYYSICIENKGYSNVHDLPFIIEVKFKSLEDIQVLAYGETKCFPVYRDDIYYEVSGVGFLIPDKEWAFQHYKFKNGKAHISFSVDEMFNIDVYRKLSLSAIITVYVMLVAAFLGILKFILSIKGLFTKKSSSR